MTLCIAWIDKTYEGEERLFMISDRRVSGGDTSDHVPKIFVFYQSNCLIAWTGNHAYTFPLLHNIRIILEDNPKMIAGYVSVIDLRTQILKRMNYVWEKINFYPPEEKTNPEACRFIFSTFDYDRQEVYLCQFENQKGVWETVDVTVGNERIRKYTYIGTKEPQDDDNPIKTVERWIEYNGLTPSCLIDVFNEVAKKFNHHVGGIPQSVILDHRGIEAFGIICNGKKYIDGIGVDNETQLSKKIRFIQYDELIYL